ncbi:tyrosine-type recombinase/integrase [Bacillus safensis]|uniref:tyrosine-type recombinase/integrase n=1 Tax=Bacillus safensis TaxID=561879 RepID=UPI00046A681A|nr:tyrosine-type recombinase/integrase [Bacillus safensis]
MEREDLIEINQIFGVSLLKQDIDLINCFTDGEVKKVLRQPNQRDYVGFRDYVAMILLLDSGMRANNLLSLRTVDIDVQTRFITLGGDKIRTENLVLFRFQHIHTVKLILQLFNEN